MTLEKYIAGDWLVLLEDLSGEEYDDQYMIVLEQLREFGAFMVPRWSRDSGIGDEAVEENWRCRCEDLDHIVMSIEDQADPDTIQAEIEEWGNTWGTMREIEIGDRTVHVDLEIALPALKAWGVSKISEREALKAVARIVDNAGQVVDGNMTKILVIDKHQIEDIDAIDSISDVPRGDDLVTIELEIVTGAYMVKKYLLEAKLIGKHTEVISC